MSGFRCQDKERFRVSGVGFQDEERCQHSGFSTVVPDTRNLLAHRNLEGEGGTNDCYLISFMGDEDDE